MMTVSQASERGAGSVELLGDKPTPALRLVESDPGPGLVRAVRPPRVLRKKPGDERLRLLRLAARWERALGISDDGDDEMLGRI
jgi:hypothetical protein